ncbi:MAG: class I SAM-dependent methyltransferase [Candidatus Thorarchaeota archaeon]
MNEKEVADFDLKQPKTQKKQKIDDKKAVLPFTARLMAYYRAQEHKRDCPLIVDPFAERLAGDMTSYVEKHRHFSESDYPIIRSYYIENNLLSSWCKTQAESQIILLGAGLDTRAYRFQPLQANSHTVFELDFALVNHYKEEILKEDQPLCELVRVAANLSNPEWSFQLIKSGFSSDTPTFWVLEGLIYYMDQKAGITLLKRAAEISAANSQIFVDICVPGLAELDFGPFARHFKWGLEKKAVQSFFANTGWDVSCSFADEYDQGRDVGQRGLIFIHGTRRTDESQHWGATKEDIEGKDLGRDVLKGSELQAFATELTIKIIAEVEEIIKIYQRNPEKGLFIYLDFIKRGKPALEKLAEGLGDRASLGLISPRLLRDPLSVDLMTPSTLSDEEKEAHIVGYLKAILQLGYCGAKGLEGWQFAGTVLHKESQKAQNSGKIDSVASLVQVVRQEIGKSEE